MSFLPKDYQEPKTGSAQYMKLQDGDNKIRILSAPILGWEDWNAEKKPVRCPLTPEMPQPLNPLQDPKVFWAMVVWDYKDSAIKILSLTQASVRRQLEALYIDEDWGSPFEYDIKINKMGKEKETKYNVTPLPRKPTTTEQELEFHKAGIKLTALFDGKDPFKDNAYPVTPFTDREAPSQEPFSNPIGELTELVEVHGLAIEHLQDYVASKAKLAGKSIDVMAGAMLASPDKFIDGYTKHVNERDALGF